MFIFFWGGGGVQDLCSIIVISICVYTHVLLFSMHVLVLWWVKCELVTVLCVSVSSARSSEAAQRKGSLEPCWCRRGPSDTSLEDSFLLFETWAVAAARLSLTLLIVQHLLSARSCWSWCVDGRCIYSKSDMEFVNNSVFHNVWFINYFLQ